MISRFINYGLIPNYFKFQGDITHKVRDVEEVVKKLSPILDENNENLLAKFDRSLSGVKLFDQITEDKAKHFAITGILFAVVFPFLPFTDRYFMDVAIMILTYIMLGWGLNIVVGLAGLLDLGYVAFYAVGAYSYALIATTFGWSFWICLPLAGLFAAFFGILLGFSSF